MHTTPLVTRMGVVALENLPAHELSGKAIGNTLAKLNRFAGRTPTSYSVAAHSVLVSRLCSTPEARIWGLLHDAHEAFLGDIISPAIELMATHAGQTAGTIIKNSVTRAKQIIDRQILVQWGVTPSAADSDEVAYFDRIAAAAEMAYFFDHYASKENPSEIERAIDLLRGFTFAGYWREDAQLWTSEARDLAKRGFCQIPEAA